MDEYKLLLDLNNNIIIATSTIIMAIVVTHRSLNHLHSSLSHLGDDSWDIHYLLFLQLLQNVVNSNKRTSTTNASTEAKSEKILMYIKPYYYSIPAVYKHWSLERVVLSLHSPVEGQH